VKRAVYVYEHSAPGSKPRRFAFGDHGGWREKLDDLRARLFRIVATGREGFALAVHLAPPK
jgi:hypothetical protein